MFYFRSFIFCVSLLVSDILTCKFVEIMMIRQRVLAKTVMVLCERSNDTYINSRYNLLSKKKRPFNRPMPINVIIFNQIQRKFRISIRLDQNIFLFRAVTVFSTKDKTKGNFKICFENLLKNNISKLLCGKVSFQLHTNSTRYCNTFLAKLGQSNQLTVSKS